MQTGIDTYLVYMQNPCPDDQITCCAQHILIMGHCFTYAEIYNNQEVLEALSDLGFVIPGPSVG